MTSKVEIGLSAKDQEILRALQKMNTSLDATANKLDRVEQSTKRGAGQVKGQFAQATQSLKNFAIGVTGVGSVLSAVQLAARQLRNEWEHLKRIQAGAAQVQISTAQAQREAIGNVGIENADVLNQQVAAITQETGADPSAVFRAIGAAVSFGANQQQAGEAVRVAALTTPDDPAAIQTQALAIAGVQQRLGGSAEEIAGFLLAAKRQAPITTEADFAANFTPALLDITQELFGDTPEDAAALLATIGKGIGDQTGRVTRTATIKLAQQLAEALPASQFPELDSTTERLEFLRSGDPVAVEKRRAILGAFEADAEIGAKGTLTGEAKSLPTLIALLSAQENEIQRLQENIRAEIPQFGPESAELFRQQQAGLNRQALQQQAAFDRQIKAATTALQLRNLEGGEGHVSREALTNLIQQTSGTELESRLRPAIKDLFSQGEPTVEDVIAFLEVERKRLEQPREGGALRATDEAISSLLTSPKAVESIGAFLGLDAPELVPTAGEVLFPEALAESGTRREPTARESEQAEILRALQTNLEELNREMKEANKRPVEVEVRQAEQPKERPQAALGR